jgi:hypothetical protein
MSSPFYKLSLSIVVIQFLCSVTSYAAAPDDVDAVRFLPGFPGRPHGPPHSEAAGDLCLSSVGSLEGVVNWDMRRLLPDCRTSSSKSTCTEDLLEDEGTRQFIEQISTMLTLLDAQTGSLTSDVISTVAGALILVSPKDRDAFVEFVNSVRLLDLSHPSHIEGYSLKIALGYIGKLAVTYDQTIRLFELFACYQLEGITPNMVTRIVDTLILVDPRDRDAFVEHVIGSRIFDLSHHMHKEGYNLNGALSHLSGLAMTYNPASLSSSTSLLPMCSSSPTPKHPTPASIAYSSWLSVL